LSDDINAQIKPDVTKSSDLVRYHKIKKVTIVGAILNVILAFSKIIFGYISQSQALVADGIHSFSDLASDALVLFAAKHASYAADENHPYGHGRIETVITVALGLFLFAIAGGITFDGIRRLMDPDALMQPGVEALFVAIISILSKEYLYRYTLLVAQQTRSNILKANAWHHRSDAISSVIVVIGVVGTMAGADYLDAVAAIGVALMIAKIGWDISIQSIRELVDTAVSPEQVNNIKQHILRVSGVKKLHILRTRQMGGNALVDVHIQVDSKISVSEGHYISESVRNKLMSSIEEVTDVMVHIDSEDDEKILGPQFLPSRDDFVSLLEARWSTIESIPSIQRIDLHYINGLIDVEMVFSLAEQNSITDAKQLAVILADQVKDVEFMGDLSVLFSQRTNLARQ